MAPPSWTLPITIIEDNPYQARVDYGDVGDLAEQILAAAKDFRDTLGLMQVPHGRVVNASGELVKLSAWASETRSNAVYRVQLLYGHRRLRAFRHLAAAGHHQYHFMPVILIEASDEAMIDAVWGENRNRRDLTAIEEANLMQSAIRTLGLNQRELAERWGLARPTVVNKLSLLTLPEGLQQAVQSGRISERVAQALLPLVRHADAVFSNFRGLTGGNPEGYFSDRSGSMPDPRTALQWLSNSTPTAVISSNRVRDYVSRVMENASWHLDEAVAGYEADLGDAIRQPVCQACSYRWNDRCLDKPCLNAKLSQMVRPVVEQASAEFGLPVSHDPSHFVEWGHDAHHLLQMWQAQSCPHLVIGWYVDNVAVRPADKTSIYVPMDARLFANLRHGVALGCTHPPAQSKSCRPADAVVAEIRRRELLDTDPLAAMLGQWRIEDAEVCRILRERARHLAQAQLLRLAAKGEGEGSPLAALLWLKDRDNRTTDETDAAKMLFNKYWGNCSIMSREASYVIRQRCLELFALLDIPSERLDGRPIADILIDQARSLCFQWSDNREFEYFRTRIAESLAPMVETVLSEIGEQGDHDARLKEMVSWLVLAHAEMATTAAK